MTNRFYVGIAALLLITGTIFTASCANKEAQSEIAITAPATTAEDEAAARRLAEENARQESLVVQKALEEQRMLEERRIEEARQRKERQELADRKRFLNEAIHFEFDSSRLLPEAKILLKQKAEWLIAFPNISVTIEGHCDERGTAEYNLSLGDRRAQNAKIFLVNIGIAPERLKTVTCGEEKPVDPRHNEEAWAQNRRTNFVID